MLTFFKKPLGIIALLLIGGVFIGGWIYFGKDTSPKIDIIVAEKRDLIQEVEVTGRVKPAESVDLAFEKSGKVTQILTEKGKKVNAGQSLVVLENAELLAQLRQAEASLESAKAQFKQYEAALEVQKAKLAELERGTRPEEIAMQKTKVANAENALIDAENNLENVKAKAAIDIQNLYDKIPDILQNAYVKADDAVRKQTDEMFDNDNTFSAQLTFLTADSQAEIDAEWQRGVVDQKLTQWKEQIDSLSSEQGGLDQAIDASLEHLMTIRSFLTRLIDAVNAAVVISPTTKAIYQTNVNAGRTNENTAIETINNQKQAIAAQKVLNKNNIDGALTKINDAKNTLSLTRSELALKEAGTTEEQIAAQEAQVKQAEANIASQEAQIEYAEANIQNIQAQIAKTILYSPLNGIITKQDAKVGEIISANAPVVSIISESQFEIEANVPEADIAKVKIGNPATVTLDAYGNDVVFEAKVVAVDPAETIIDGVATYKTTIQFVKKDERVKSGMTANIDIVGDKRTSVIAVPQRAVITKNGDKIIKILEKEIVKEVEVKTGFRSSDGYVEILDGINEGDKVIIFGGEEK